ncbi:hypothetical protein D3C73_387880 [compost metagenome]
MKTIIYTLLSKWHLYFGVKFRHPVKRYHFERFEHYNQLRRGEAPRIPRDKLYRRL